MCANNDSSRLLKLTTLGYDQVSITGIVTSPNKPEINNGNVCILSEDIEEIPDTRIILGESGHHWPLESVKNKSELTQENENLTSEIGFKILRSDINTIFFAGMVDGIRSLQDRDKEQEAHPTTTTIPSKNTMQHFIESKDKQSLFIVVPGASSQAEEPVKLPVEMLGLQNKHLVEVQVEMLAIEVKFEEREDDDSLSHYQV